MNRVNYRNRCLVAQQKVIDEQPQQPDLAEQQLMKRAELLQYLLMGLGALAMGSAGLFGWLLLTKPWPFLGLPVTGVVASVPWLLVLFIDDEQSKQMGAHAFWEKLVKLGRSGALLGLGGAALTLVAFLVMWIWDMWPTGIL